MTAPGPKPGIDPNDESWKLPVLAELRRGRERIALGWSNAREAARTKGATAALEPALAEHGVWFKHIDGVPARKKQVLAAYDLAIETEIARLAAEKRKNARKAKRAAALDAAKAERHAAS